MCSTRKQADLAHARYSSARANLLSAVAELAATDAWHGDGASDLAAWLAARWQMSIRTAKELVRDARALEHRPALSAALVCGSISIDQSKALAVLCREEDDDEAWLEVLSFWSCPELEREARKQTARELERKDGGTYLRMQHTPDERFVRGEFRLHPEDGAVLISALDSLVPVGTPLRGWDAASAVALVELAKGSDAAGRHGRPTVLVSVSDDALRDADDVAALRSGAFVGAETARRLSCDANTQALFKDHEGRISGIGRTTATVPAATRRAVEDRDGRTCTFPGCERDAFLECHHIVHRAHGGSNQPSNLQLVCWTHHTLIHEGGWSLRGEAGPNVTWVRPDGRPFEPRVRVVLDTS